MDLATGWFIKANSGESNYSHWEMNWENKRVLRRSGGSKDAIAMNIVRIHLKRQEQNSEIKIIKDVYLIS